MILNTGAGAVLPPPPLIHISLLPHYHQTHLAGTNILKDILSRTRTWKHSAPRFMYISLVLGRVVPDCRMWIVFCLFLIIPHQPILLYFSLNHQYLGLVLDIAFLLFTFTTLPHLLSNIWNFDNVLAPSSDQQSLVLGFASQCLWCGCGNFAAKMFWSQTLTWGQLCYDI